MKKIGAWSAAVALPCCFAFAVSADSDTTAPVFREVDVSGFTAFQFGQIQKGDMDGSPIDHEWFHNAALGIKAVAGIGEFITVIANLEGKLWVPFESVQKKEFRRRQMSIWIQEAQGIFSLYGDNASSAQVNLHLGCYQYKYNSNSRNLGEYLFRTWTFPPLIFSEFDYPRATLLGAWLETRVWGCLKQDLMLTTSWEWYPFYDFSLSYCVKYDFRNVFQAGAGVDFDRIFPVDRSKTSPETMLNYYLTENSDTSYYSFGGVKVAAHASFDPKRLLVPSGSCRFFGANDLKLYAEIAVLGFHDYRIQTGDGGDYDIPFSERMPVMIGFNLPTSKWGLDVLACELEYYPSKLPMDREKSEVDGQPVPDIDFRTYDPGDYAGDDIKWSVYTAKRMFKRFVVKAQVASDHRRTMWVDGFLNYGEHSIARDHWYWVVKTEFDF
jgi:hypothetical protein